MNANGQDVSSQFERTSMTFPTNISCTIYGADEFVCVNDTVFIQKFGYVSVNASGTVGCALLRGKSTSKKETIKNCFTTFTELSH